MGFKFSLRGLFGRSAQDVPQCIDTPLDYEKILMTVRHAQIPSLEIPNETPDASRKNIEDMREINTRGLQKLAASNFPKR